MWRTSYTLFVSYKSLKLQYQRRRISKFQPIRNQEMPVVAMFLQDHDKMKNDLYRELPKHHSYKVWFQLAQQFQRKTFFVYWSIGNKNVIYQPYLLSDHNEKRKFCRGLSKHHSCKVWFLLAKQFQSKLFFVYQPIRNKNASLSHVFVKPIKNLKFSQRTF